MGGTDWEKLTMIHVLVGFEAEVFGMAKYINGASETKALLIIAFLLYILASMLVGLMRVAGVKRNIIISILVIGALVFSALCSVIGVVLQLDSKKYIQEIDPYAASLELAAALMAFCGSVFMLMNVLCGGIHGTET